MKKYNFLIDKSYMDRFFSPVKNKIQFIELLMNSIKYMLINPDVKKERGHGQLVLVTGKTSRLCFFKEDKYFSIAFPFSVKFEDAYFFSFRNKINIDSRLTSDVIALINDNDFQSNCCIDFASPITEYQDSINEHYWDFVRELLLMEDGYFRYDYDQVNYEKHGRSDIHPLNHYDLFYSSNATFKIGLANKISHDDFFDLINIKTDCKFIN